MAAVAGLLVFLTPILYPLHLGLPSLLQSYLNGAGHPEYFSIIPWIAFPICGMTFGYLLLEARERDAEHRFFQTVAVAGILAYAIGMFMSLFPILQYGFFDYSLTSPHFFFIRLGLLLLILYGAYRWSQRLTADHWSPLKAFGQASLVVYWIHIEVVYGRLAFNWGFIHNLQISHAALQLLWFIPSVMLIVLASRYWETCRDYLRATLGAIYDRAFSLRLVKNEPS